MINVYRDVAFRLELWFPKEPKKVSRCEGIAAKAVIDPTPMFHWQWPHITLCDFDVFTALPEDDWSGPTVLG